ncbi:MAG: hypothetical protein OJJ21_20865 [Ferrovibrio sp.]|uniref:hypothetical protein n=1 Tax=Ferrovibrio sp. TaxID=1917215 RepID=UPI00261A4347|nr:hypothetical protein [Ferrovibrio sp.]MCW0236061.1 hypothetical protein [Ferrovibrio sp.]
MANRPDHLTPTDPFRLPAQPQAERSRAAARLEQARADLSRMARSTAKADAEAPQQPDGATPTAPPAAYDPAAIAARIDLMRGRFTKAREDAVSALLFLSDAQQDCDALSEAADANRWPQMAAGIQLLSQSLRRALPAEARHLDLIGLLIDALYALRRAETRPDMGRAGEDLLRGLRLAVARELSTTDA